MKLILAVLVLVPSLSFAATRSLCERQVARSSVANANAEAMKMQYAEAQAVYERELQQNKSSITTDQAQLSAAMKSDIDAEWALLDANLRAEGAKRTDVNGNLSDAYLRLRKETEARIDVIVARYTAAMNDIASSYNAASYAKVMSAYEEAVAATEEARYAYEAAVEACH